MTNYLVTLTEPSVNTVEEKPVLFTTEDGVEIHKGDERELWRIFVKPNSYEMWKPYELGMPYAAIDGEKYFSTEQAAEQYIIDNKPSLSAKDIYSLTALHGAIMHDLEKEIELTVKDK